MPIGHNGGPALESRPYQITAGQFVRHFCENARRISPAARKAIQKAAQARLIDRWTAGRADSPLYFDDLCEAIEAALIGRSNVILRGVEKS